MPNPFFEDDILPVKVDRGRPTLEGELISENFLNHLIATGQFHNGNYSHVPIYTRALHMYHCGAVHCPAQYR
jgi:hypothetical protein